MHKLLARNLKKVWDAETKAFYYINKVTVIAWDKPKLLGDDDIDPTPRAPWRLLQVSICHHRGEHAEVFAKDCRGPGGRMIQGMFRSSRAHMMDKLLARNFKVWDAEAKAFYYINKGIAWDSQAARGRHRPDTSVFAAAIAGVDLPSPRRTRRERLPRSVETRRPA